MRSFKWKGYWKPTPKNIRKLGDAFLGVFSITSVSSMIMEDKKLAIASLILGVVGKVLSNFFTDEPNKEELEEEAAKIENDVENQSD